MTDSQIQRKFQQAEASRRAGRPEESLRLYEQLLRLEPSHAGALSGYAILLQQLGRSREALERTAKALEAMEPPDPLVLNNCAIVLQRAGQYDAASEAFEQALALAPATLEIQANLATTYLLQGRLNEAELRYLKLAPHLEEAAPWLNLARIALQRGDMEQAEKHLAKAEDLDPTHPDLALLRARLAHQVGDHEAAWQACCRGLTRSPAHQGLWLQLRSLDAAVFDLDQLEKRLLALESLEVRSSCLLAGAVDLCRRHWIWQPLSALERQLAPSLLISPDGIPSSADLFTLLGAAIPQQAHCAAAILLWAQLAQQIKPLEPPAARPRLGRPLRVAFLSSDLRGHAIGHLVVGLFESLPSGAIEWWAYHNCFDDGSSTRDRLQAPFARSIQVAKLSDQELAERIRADAIDVLIDLNQWTADTRVTALAWRPAPVQIQWLGMPGTLGAGRDVDYVIVDPWVVDGTNAEGFSECLLQLPRSYQPNDHQPPDLALCPSREAAGLPAEGPVLGVFNQYYKFSPDTLALWGEILRQLPEAWLWLLEPDSEQLKARVMHQCAAVGIAAERVIFAPKCPQALHLARLRWMDLVLDTWPYNAHTTASDALRAGVPVLTLPGETFASRVAAGILHSAGLGEWVAATPAEYVNKAVAFGAQGRTAIDAAKARVHSTYWASPMVDNAALGRQLEAALLAVFDRAAEGLEPTSLQLNADLSLTPLPFGRQAGGPVPGWMAKGDSAEPAVSTASLPAAAVVAKAEQPDWVNELERGGRTSRLTNLAVLQRQVLQLAEPPGLLDVGRIGSGPHAHDQLAEQQLAGLHKAGAEGVLDGSTTPWHSYKAEDLSSHLPLRDDWLALFPGYNIWGQPQGSHEIKTRSLVQLLPEGASPPRLLYLDLRGCELRALQRCPELLSELALLHCRLAVTPMHQGGSCLWDLGQWLQQQGYVLHMLGGENKRLLRPLGRDDNPQAGRNQLLQIEAVFMPDPLGWMQLEEPRLLALAFFAQALFRSTDVAMRVLEVLDRRDRGSRVAALRTYLEVAGSDA
jgi:predicted O-linked N-acetylglucosamine transferase (SPINDLY family)